MKTGFLAGILVLGVTAGLPACGSDSITEAVALSALVERRGACPQNYELIDVEEAGDSAAGVDANGDGFVCRRVFRSGKVRFTDALFQVMA